MRIGKPLEHAQAAVKTLTISDPILKYTALGRQLGYAGYLVNDMLIWVSLLPHEYLDINDTGNWGLERRISTILALPFDALTPDCLRYYITDPHR